MRKWFFSFMSACLLISMLTACNMNNGDTDNFGTMRNNNDNDNATILNNDETHPIPPNQNHDNGKYDADNRYYNNELEFKPGEK
ncbi:hypothetical protein [Litchfieldia alkalitelluris]|uniref:hypothetical protein n=1 Tax=Litchfieldia alkalitelluris TaxID=304268 RepID=UPI000998DE27|nr:hypothetical protein [Litchfieldia alkalitelluris]